MIKNTVFKEKCTGLKTKLPYGLNEKFTNFDPNKSILFNLNQKFNNLNKRKRKKQIHNKMINDNRNFDEENFIHEIRILYDKNIIKLKK